MKEEFVGNGNERRMRWEWNGMGWELDGNERGMRWEWTGN